jgi:hypothetical protein
VPRSSRQRSGRNQPSRASSAGTIRADQPADLLHPHDQITTRERPEFTRLRADITRIIRNQPGPDTAAARHPSPAQETR